MRFLESRGIPFVAREYDASGDFHSALEAAQLIGVSADAVYKTLVILRATRLG
jgi:prolyl-tRNA editing enzyme YbaK/EbsC (Cys-tRNA(Pro) deacylase)